MKLDDTRQAYYEYSGTLSTINRQLALSGIAIIWFFVQPEKNQNFNFGSFKWAFIFFSIALFFDLTHYAIAAASWGIYHRFKEKRITDEKQKFEAPLWINWVPILMLILKVSFTILGYYVLIHNTVLSNAFK
jgi:hypothetical protein